MAPRRLVLAVGLVVLVALLGGCVALPTTDDTPDPADVFEDTFVHSDDLEDIHGERTTTVTHGDESRTEVVAVAERPYVEYRSEILESPAEDRVGAVYVSNATAAWQYLPESNTATVYEAAEPYDNDVVEAARADEADRQRDRYDLEYRGTETVADREAHVLAVEATNESVADGISLLVGDTEFVYALETVEPSDDLAVTEQTIWIDTEYAYPLKETVVAEVDGETYEYSERFEDITFNDGLDDQTFAFEPPENASVEEFT
ncbi:outer membrane lipoprotein carrier protein LolA [Salinadaptatus halalkaliphilus]|uniref:Outer membrane lipoprotein carrier protein LolA n=1 Tax=Salinadaptatus halalkaliphilus TaxID=2419781 RepID=A0A4S3TTR0_9EURY|nr:DUF2092 domain-containing protein [Salinadaptatus halalkaliphilus]THE66018.1 outer membrane lipoprotein carrier protein LolA [Salinadaptatus halalkaliphilus]